MNVPDHLRYTKEHEWVEADGDRCRVGITDYAQDALGDIVFVQLPEVGTAVEAMAACSEIESTKSVSEIYAPVSGTIAATNEQLADDPERVNTDPYGEGWIFTIEMSDPGQLDALLDAGTYETLIEQE